MKMFFLKKGIEKNIESGCKIQDFIYLIVYIEKGIKKLGEAEKGRIKR